MASSAQDSPLICECAAWQVVSRGAGVNGGLHISFWQVARSVLLFLGVPLLAGIATRYALLWTIGRESFEKRFIPCFGPVALLGLIYTIIVMFSLQGHQVCKPLSRHSWSLVTPVCPVDFQALACMAASKQPSTLV